MSYSPTELLAFAPKLIDRDGFIQVYYDKLQEHKKAGEAYWAVEDIHQTIFGRTKYNGHEVFKSVLSRWNSARRDKLKDKSRTVTG